MAQPDASTEVTPTAPTNDAGHRGRPLGVLLGQLGLAALGLYVAIEAQSLGLWTALGPGPGLLPLVLGVSLLGLTAVWFVQTVIQLRRRSLEAQPSEDRLDRTYAVGVVVGLALLASLMDLLGFQISMALFLFAELTWLGRQKWWVSAIIALVGSVGIFVLFDRVLAVQLPLSSLSMLSGLGL